MTEKNYPYEAWVLMPSFKPKLETFVRKGNALYDEAKSGKWYRTCDVYETKELAIKGGWKIVNSQQVDINKRQGNLNKRIAALQKAELG